MDPAWKGVVLFNPMHVLPRAVVNGVLTIDTLLLATAMAALVLPVQFSAGGFSRVDSRWLESPVRLKLAVRQRFGVFAWRAANEFLEVSSEMRLVEIA